MDEHDGRTGVHRLVIREWVEGCLDVLQNGYAPRALHRMHGMRNSRPLVGLASPKPVASST
jgi:hypothetical protein